MTNFRTLKIWQVGMELVKDIYQLSGLLPGEEKYGLKSQLTRAAVSIPSNIAEGCSRSSKRDFKRFLEVALGSAFELETQLVLVLELKLVKNKESIKNIIGRLEEEQKMINGYIKRLGIRN